MLLSLFFFFSSRRRHTRLTCDWSSDVCSSDLVEDHCAGIELVLLQGAAGEIYNIGGGDEHENIEVAERLLELTGAARSLLRSVPDRPGHDRRYSVDSTKLHDLGWSPQTPFEIGLRETVSWYRENRSWWEPIKSGDYRQYYEI